MGLGLCRARPFWLLAETGNWQVTVAVVIAQRAPLLVVGLALPHAMMLHIVWPCRAMLGHAGERQ